MREDYGMIGDIHAEPRIDLDYLSLHIYLKDAYIIVPAVTIIYLLTKIVPAHEQDLLTYSIGATIVYGLYLIMRPFGHLGRRNWQLTGDAFVKQKSHFKPLRLKGNK